MKNEIAQKSKSKKIIVERFKSIGQSILTIKAAEEIIIEEYENIKDTELYRTNVKQAINTANTLLQSSLEKEMVAHFTKNENKTKEEAEEMAQSYYAAFGFYEKWTKKISRLDVDNLMNLDALLDKFFAGEFEFENQNKS